MPLTYDEPTTASDIHITSTADATDGTRITYHEYLNTRSHLREERRNIMTLFDVIYYLNRMETEQYPHGIAVATDFGNH